MVLVACGDGGPQVSVEISVVICTLDRPDLVRAAVKSLRAQTIAPSQFEVIVVDNGTGEVARDLADLSAVLPNLRLIHEPTTGLSHARNRGTTEARGTAVLFMDDDALAEPDLLCNHLRHLSAPHRPVGTGGRIYLRWPDERPAWLPRALESYYSALDLGDEARPMRFPEYPYGANMAVRRDALLEVGGFDIALGRHGTNLLSGEEKDLFLRLSHGAGQVDYVPDAVVHHCVLPERTEPRWLLRRSWAQGRTDVAMGAVIDGRPRPIPHALARSALHLGRALRHGSAVAGIALTRGGAAERMHQASLALRWLGAAYEGVRRAVRRSA